MLQEVCGIEGCGEPWTWGLLKILCAMLVWVFAGRSRMPLRKRGSCGWNTVVSMLTRICQRRCGHQAIVSNTLMDDLKLLSRAKHMICIERRLQMLDATCNYYWLSTKRWRKRRCQAWILDFTILNVTPSGRDTKQSNVIVKLTLILRFETAINFKGGYLGDVNKRKFEKQERKAKARGYLEWIESWELVFHERRVRKIVPEAAIARARNTPHNKTTHFTRHSRKRSCRSEEGTRSQ